MWPYLVLEKENTKIIKQLLLGGAFENSDAVDHEVLTAVFARYQEHPRNHFLINIVPYHFQLVSGSVLHEPHNSGSNSKHFEEQNFFTMMYLSNGSSVINKLHLLWGLQRKLVHSYNLIEFIVPELKKLSFVGGKPQNQLLINKEVNFTLSTAF